MANQPDTTALLRRDLLSRIEKTAPRLIMLEAPAGYGKSTLARQVVASQPVGVVDALGYIDPLDYHRRLLDGLVAAGGTETVLDVERDAANLLSLEAWRALCLRVWSESADAGYLIFENSEGILEQPELIATINELLARSQPTRKAIMCTRRPLPIRIGRFAYPHEVLRLGINDLRFSRAELTKLLGLKPDDDQLDLVDDATRGWPIAVFLLRRLLHEGYQIADFTRHQGTDLFSFLADEVLALLSRDAWEALFVIVALADATVGDVESALGSRARDAIAALQTEAPFVDVRGDLLEPHPLLREIVREREPEAVRAAAERAAQGHLEAGRYLRAARIRLDRRDTVGAAAALEAVAESAWLDSPSYELNAILELLDRPALVAHPRLWAYASTVSRCLYISPQEWLHEGLEIWSRHQTVMPLETRIAVLGNISNAYMCLGMLDECDRWVGIMQETDPLSTVVKLWATAIDAMWARPLDVEALHDWCLCVLKAGHPRAVYLYDVVVRIYRLRGERERERAASAQALDYAHMCGNPVSIVLTASDAAFGAWIAGEDSLYQHYLTIVRHEWEVNPNEYIRHFIECINGLGLSIRPGNEKIKTRAYGYLIAASLATDDRIALLERAVEAGDTSMQPYARIITRVALAVADPERAPRLLGEAASIGEKADSPQLRDAVASLQSRGNGGMLSALVKRFRRSQSTRSIELITGRCVIDGVAISPTDRQLELLMLLAARRRGMHRQELAETLWPDASLDAALGSLRTTISRLRALPGMKGLVATSNDGYTLAADVTVDLDQLRRVVSQGEHAASLDAGQREMLERSFENLLRRDQSRAARWDWFSETERELETLLYRAGAALMRDATQQDVRHAVDLATKMLAYDPLDETARATMIRGLRA